MSGSAAHELEVVAVGDLELLATHASPAVVRSAHGRLWQWVGDGSPLVNLLVAERESRLADSAGALDSLRARVSETSERLSDIEIAEDYSAGDVAGSSGAWRVAVTGLREGNRLRLAALMSAGRRRLHLIEVAVADSSEGTQIASRILDSVTDVSARS